MTTSRSADVSPKLSPTGGNRRQASPNTSQDIPAYVITKKKMKVNKKPTITGALSEISSLDGDEDVDLLNPESRKFINDKEYLKFVTI